MPIPQKYLADFEEDGIYHVYNRTNNKEPLFLNDENRLFFLKRYKELLFAYTDTYCWSLLSNHFHFLIKIKPAKDIKAFLFAKPTAETTITEKNTLKMK